MYEGVRPERVGDLIADKTDFLAAYDLAKAERTALMGPDFAAILGLGGLPNLVFRYYRAHGLALNRARDDRLGLRLSPHDAGFPAAHIGFDDFNDHLKPQQPVR